MGYNLGFIPTSKSDVNSTDLQIKIFFFFIMRIFVGMFHLHENVIDEFKVTKHFLNTGPH